MKIKEVTYQSRRDFRAIFECEHCGRTEDKWGYDDYNYHHNVIPGMVCENCGKKAGENYRALETRYAEGVQV